MHYLSIFLIVELGLGFGSLIVLKQMLHPSCFRHSEINDCNCELQKIALQCRGYGFLCKSMVQYTDNSGCKCA